MKSILKSGVDKFFSRTALGSQDEEPAEKAASRTEDTSTSGFVIGRGRPRKDEQRITRNFVSTSIGFDSEQYLKLREIAYTERLSIKETVFYLLREAISRYEKSGKLKK